MAAACVQAAEPATFSFTLPHSVSTSAGVFDWQGRLVRAVWAMKATPAGEQSATWDGLDDLGHNVPPGAYQVRIALNGGAVPRPGHDHQQRRGQQHAVRHDRQIRINELKEQAKELTGGEVFSSTGLQPESSTPQRPTGSIVTLWKTMMLPMPHQAASLPESLPL